MDIRQSNICIGRSAKDRSAEAHQPGLDGAVAALETFYYGFNSHQPDVITRIWADNPQVQLNNPLGGILKGHDGINELYRRVLVGPARVWVEFFDVVVYETHQVAVFAGRERGECEFDGEVLPLRIRTSRVFIYLPRVGWRQAHHHGSIDEAKLLDTYQRLIDRANSTPQGKTGE